MRAGNVIGGGDFAVDRIIPDCVRAAEKEQDILIRNPDSIRPYQHVLEPVLAYLRVAVEQLQNKSWKEPITLALRKKTALQRDRWQICFARSGKNCRAESKNG